jgi:hypothetical protein
MTTTIIKNTGIEELLEVSAGNFGVLERMTEEFGLQVQKPTKRAERFNRKLEFVLKSPEGACTTSVSADLSPSGDRLTITISQI